MRVPVEEDRCLYVEPHGHGARTPVVLVHGGAMNRHNWDGVVPALVSAGHPTVTFDLRACGRSDRDFVNMGVQELGLDVVTVLATLDIERAAVVGWSVGGAIAVAAAHALGARLDRLVVVGGATPRLLEDVDYPGLPRELVDLVDQARAADRSGFWRGMSASLFHTPDPGLAEYCWELYMSSGARFEDTLTDIAKLDQRALLPQISAPALVCHGRHDLHVPLHFGEALAQLLPNGRLVVFDDSGHAPFLEEPQLFLAELMAFLADGA